jgi:hypothetical protein
MLIIYGRRTARIKKYRDNGHACNSCGVFDLEVKVYRDYYHIFFVPLLPIGNKSVKIKCNSCGQPMRLDAIQKQYESINKTPFYLYTIPILLGALIVILVAGNLKTQKEKAAFVANPKIGDVYRIRKDENNSTTYFFLRLASIKGDTVVAYHNNLEYHGFVTTLNDDDFFVKDEELYFTKHQLKEMLDRMEINSVERGYRDSEGFNRMK